MYLSSKLPDINFVFIGLLFLTNLEFSVTVFMDISQSYNTCRAVNQGQVKVVKVVNERVYSPVTPTTKAFIDAPKQVVNEYVYSPAAPTTTAVIDLPSVVGSDCKQNSPAHFYNASFIRSLRGNNPNSFHINTQLLSDLGINSKHRGRRAGQSVRLYKYKCSMKTLLIENEQHDLGSGIHTIPVV